jgi:hypothetical protein
MKSFDEMQAGKDLSGLIAIPIYFLNCAFSMNRHLIRPRFHFCGISSLQDFNATVVKTTSRAGEFSAAPLKSVWLPDAICIAGKIKTDFLQFSKSMMIGWIHYFLRYHNIWRLFPAA